MFNKKQYKILIKQSEDLDKIINAKEKEIKKLKKERRLLYENLGLSIYGFKQLKLDLNRIDEFIADILKAHSFAEIAEKYKVLPKTVMHWITVLDLSKFVEKNKKLMACIERNKMLSEKLLLYHEERGEEI